MSAPKAAVIQMNTGAERDANLDAAGRLLREAAAAGARIAVLPENFAFMGAHEADKLALAEVDGSGPIQAFLAHSARTLGLWIVGGTIPLAVPGDAGRVHAACGVWNDTGARVARYDKIHLFDVEVPRLAKSSGLRGDAESPATDGRAGSAKAHGSRATDGGKTSAGVEHYRESATIAPGALNPVVVDTPVGRLGLSVCYDLRFPELYRALAVAGAEVLCVPSAFTERTGAAHWDLLLRARAVENLCHVLASNQCGSHAGGRRTWGHSCIVEPWGEISAAVSDEPGIAVAELDAGRRDTLRRSFPVLEHRRLS